MKALGLAATVVLATVACQPEAGPKPDDLQAAVDSTMSSESPGLILRFGPATPEEIAAPTSLPIVYGAQGQVSIYEGFFIQGPCHEPLRVDAGRQDDTITVRLASRVDTARAEPCREEPRPQAYAILVGPFEAGTYAVRLVHQGDRARPEPLDTVYSDIVVEPTP